MRRDVASAYALALVRIGSWMVVLALVYRRMGPAAFATLALVRATVGLLNYTAVGIGPAMVHMLARIRNAPPRLPPSAPVAGDAVPTGAAPEDASPARAAVLSYATPQADAPPLPIVSPLQSLYYSGLVVTGFAAVGGGLLLMIYVAAFVGGTLRVAPGFRSEIQDIVLLMGAGVLLRVISEAPGAVLQTAGRITLDNVLLAAAELFWVAVCLVLIVEDPDELPSVSGAFAVASAALLLARVAAAQDVAPIFNVRMRLDLAAGARLLGFGLMVTLAQAADFLYSPTDYLIINQLLGPSVVAVYAPAVQIDSGLLLLVGGLAAVILPRTALAHAAGRADLVRRYYLRGTLAGAAVLTAAAAVVWLLAPWILRLWLGDPMPATRAILPLVLIHTVVGGSSAVGRSILLGTGRVKPFTISVLVAGAANVVLSYVFVRYLNLGLTGIVLGTIISVVARAGIWMPWYVLRTLRHDATPAAPAPTTP